MRTVPSSAIPAGGRRRTSTSTRGSRRRSGLRDTGSSTRCRRRRSRPRSRALRTRRCGGGGRRTCRRSRLRPPVRRRPNRRRPSDPRSGRSSPPGRSRPEPVTTLGAGPNRTDPSHRSGARRRDRSESVAMDFDLPPEDHPTRQRVRDWIAANPNPTGKDLAEAGYVVPHWPAPWGLDADPIDQLVIDDELARARIRRPNNQIGIGWAAPTILLAGTPEQHERYLPKIFSGEEFWCQLFSETEAGSDLANLATRAEARWRRVRDQRFEDLVERCASFRVRHPDRPHRSGPAEAQGHLVLHHADGLRGALDVADRRHDHRTLVQPGLLRQRPAPGRQSHRRGGRRVATREGHPLERARVAVVGGLDVGRRPVGRAVDRSVSRSRAASPIRCCANGRSTCTSKPSCSDSTDSGA